jgi:membrane protein YqaA with SNARE-associated domain
MMAEEKRTSPVRWGKLAVTLVLFALVSVGLGFVLSHVLGRFSAQVFPNAWVAYGGIFLFTLLVNLSILPLPFAVSVMIAMATQWNPVLIALFGSLGACLGEFSGYLIGYLGKKIAIPEDTPGYQMMHRWIVRYGWWAIAFLSFQPVIPFEIGGILAGIAKMPVKKFLPALWLGKFPKYLILIYGGTALFRLIPFLHR